MNKIKELIPEFFYDLIARITPGSILLVAVCWHWQVSPMTLKRFEGTILVALALIASYVLGFFLDHISYMLIYFPDRLVKRILLKRASGSSSKWKVDTWEVLRSTKDDSDTVVLLKMTAERVMIRSVMMIWVISCFLEVPPSDLDIRYKVGVLFVFIGSLYLKDYYLYDRAWTIQKKSNERLDY